MDMTQILTEFYNLIEQSRGSVALAAILVKILLHLRKCEPVPEEIKKWHPLLIQAGA